MSAQGSLTGKTFNGRYELGDRIGIGGMAEVYSAQDMVLGRTVAVKVMLPQYSDDKDFTRRFRQEAAAAANLQSPYIVNVYDWGHDDDTYYIVMEFVRGSDLKTAIEQRGAINQRKVAEIGVQVCQALSVAHQQDIIHRDIKPQNIMVQPDGNIKVMDFGIARAKNSMADKTQTVLGTAHYISPEQAQGQELSAASDIYSLGVVLYEAVTGTLPFDGPDAVSVALMQVKDEPPLPHDINPDIDPEMEDIILTAMEKDPARRFPTANEMRLALNDYLQGRSAPVQRGGGFTSAQTSVISPIGAAAAGAAVGAGAMGAMGGIDTANAMGSTQVMPAAAVGNGGYNQSSGANYRAGSSNGGRGFDGKDPNANRKRNTIIAVCSVLAVVVIAALVYLFACNGEKVTVPDVTGMKTEAAVEAIEAAGFEVGTMDSAYDEKAEAGTVLSQNPRGGSQAPKGSKINIVVSQGNEKVPVPDVKNMTTSEATKTLLDVGFVIGTVTEKDSDTVESGKVISTDPVGGSEANKGSKINLVVSKGAGEGTIPDVQGLSEAAAQAKIEAAGFVYVRVATESSSSVSAGSVIRQTPSAGTKATKGSTVSCVISSGAPEPTPTPTPTPDPGPDTSSSSSSSGSDSEN